MKIFFLSLCIVTILLLVCSFSVEAAPGKCKPPQKWNAKAKKCLKPGKPAAKTTAAASTAAGDTTASAAADPATTAAPA
ncbi:hypothetical protein KR067_005138 [Drosophila pandora]|nr:hypothetical protein KR067_005138 [Drosophila pandora]